MIVKCIRDPEKWSRWDKGHLYKVLGIFELKEKKQYLIDSGLSYFADADDFEVVDPQESIFWVESSGPRGKGKSFPVAFEPHFYENYRNWAPRESLLIETYLDFMDREYPNPIWPTAIHYQDYWCECPLCEHLWENHSVFGLITCPQRLCYRMLNNPLADHDKILDSPEVSALNEMSEFKNLYYADWLHKYIKNSRSFSSKLKRFLAIR